MTTLTLKMTATQIVETSVNVNNSPIQDYMITQTVMPHLLKKGLLVSNLSQLCNVSLIEANHINTLLFSSNQNGDLAGHMSFKNYLHLCCWLGCNWTYIDIVFERAQ